MVSYICKIVDEKLCENYGFKDKKQAWSKNGIMRAIKIITDNRNLLFDDMIKKLDDHKKLDKLIKDILVKGMQYEYSSSNKTVEIGAMFGILVNKNGKISVSNRIFETYLYDKYILDDVLESRIINIARNEKEQFIENGFLNMKLILKKFQEHFTQCYKDEFDKEDKRFLEDNGRFLFLTFIRPIINGAGNFYVEARTRNNRRTDVIIDYNARQYIIELKIWRGDEYNKRGEVQLFDYLSYYNADKGYLVSYNFNKNKQSTYEELYHDGKSIIEVVI